MTVSKELPAIAPSPHKVVGMGVTVLEHEKEAIQKRIAAIMESGWWMWGDQQAELMARVQGWTGRKHCVTFNSATSAASVLFRWLASEQGDKRSIVFQGNQFPSPVFAAVEEGLSVRFADINMSAASLSPSTLQDAWDNGGQFDIVVAQWTGGFVSRNARAIRDWCDDHKVTFIEDAAQAFGSEGWCETGLASIVSLSSTKALHAGGQGGLLITDNDDLATYAFQMKTYGRDGMFQSGKWVKRGGNYHMSEIAAAVALVMMDTFHERLAARYNQASAYVDALVSFGDFPGMAAARARSGVGAAAAGPNYYKLPMLIHSVDREVLRAACKAANVELGSGVYDWFLPEIEPLREFVGLNVERVLQHDLPVSRRFSAEHFCLPVHNAMTIESLPEAIRVIRQGIEQQTA